jgi:hypothetical protein
MQKRASPTRQIAITSRTGVFRARDRYDDRRRLLRPFPTGLTMFGELGLASAVAIAPTRSPNWCTGAPHLNRIKADGAGFGALVLMPFPFASPASSGASFFSSVFAVVLLEGGAGPQVRVR